MSKTGNLGNRRKFIINTLYYALIVGIVFLAFRYLFNLIWPFFLAFLFSSLLTAPIRLLTEKCRMRRNLAATLCLIVFFALLGGIAVFLMSRVVSWIADLVVWLQGLYGVSIRPALDNLSNYLEDLAGRISPETSQLIRSYLPSLTASISSAVSRVTMQIVSFLSGQATRMPNRLVSTAIFIIATIFMTGDYPRITAFLLRQVPDRQRNIVREGRKSLGDIILKFGKSYGIIMGITFLEMLVGLLVIHPQNAFFIALLIAVFDIFPIVGAGTILVPWGVLTLLNGEPGRGAGLLVLWLIEICARQIFEPRIVGYQIGLHPIITLMSMFVGTKLFGMIGLFGLPITCAIVKSLDAAGVIHFIKHDPSADASDGGDVPADGGNEAPPAEDLPSPPVSSGSEQEN